jgi:hypothetical protein
MNRLIALSATLALGLAASGCASLSPSPGPAGHYAQDEERPLGTRHSYAAPSSRQDGEDSAWPGVRQAILFSSSYDDFGPGSPPGASYCGAYGYSYSVNAECAHPDYYSGYTSDYRYNRYLAPSLGIGLALGGCGEDCGWPDYLDTAYLYPSVSYRPADYLAAMPRRRVPQPNAPDVQQTRFIREIAQASERMHQAQQQYQAQAQRAGQELIKQQAAALYQQQLQRQEAEAQAQRLQYDLEAKRRQAAYQQAVQQQQSTYQRALQRQQIGYSYLQQSMQQRQIQEQMRQFLINQQARQAGGGGGDHIPPRLEYSPSGALRQEASGSSGESHTGSGSSLQEKQVKALEDAAKRGADPASTLYQQVLIQQMH